MCAIIINAWERCDRTDDKGHIIFVPPSTYRVVEMRDARHRLKTFVEDRYNETQTPVRILFDLRSCALGLPQMHFTLLHPKKNETFMRLRVERSVALVPSNLAVKALCDLFLRLYTPVRPFSIEIDAEEAEKFLAMINAE